MSRFIRRTQERSISTTLPFDPSTEKVSAEGVTSTSTSGAKVGTRNRFTVFNTNIDSVGNGGALCNWKVPSGVNWVSIEMWGGGAGGPATGSSNCNAIGQPGGPGAFACRYMQVNEGDTFVICAAGSSCCTCYNSGSCYGCSGNPSFVNYNGALAICAGGGIQGYTCHVANCQYTRPWQNEAHSQGFADFNCNLSYGQRAWHGTYVGTNPYCHDGRQIIPSAPRTGPDRHGMSGCVSGSDSGSGYYHMGVGGSGGYTPTFPGGGGAGGQSCCAWGMFGAGGLVVVTYGG